MLRRSVQANAVLCLELALPELLNEVFDSLNAASCSLGDLVFCGFSGIAIFSTFCEAVAVRCHSSKW